MRNAAFLLSLLCLLLLSGCQDERQLNAFCENDEIRLMVGFSIS